jgi:hypothetical protein
MNKHRIHHTIKICFYFLFLLCCIPSNGKASNVPGEDSTKLAGSYKRIYYTERIAGELPEIDGKLNDACWFLGQWSQNFVQQLPKENSHASENTKIKVLYDDKYIYVAIRAFQRDMNKIHRYFGKRDDFKGDIVGICFDSYFDHRFGFEFDLTAAGSQIDLMLDNSGTPDLNWNAVWDGATALEDSAWTAEMRIPLSQLRFNNKDSQVWGMHAWRWINRFQEEDQWSLIPRNNSGYIYSFGEMHGINKIDYKQRIELFPYTLGKIQFSKKVADNPFASGVEKSMTAGLDGKISIGSNFNADFAINPDFGQVEADPSVMNLSAFETYFEEKRPFFLEGRNIINYSLDGDYLFYSRRIGHAPTYWPDIDNNNLQFAKNPENTSIISAVKISGKTTNGLSLGILQGLTSRENVEISKPGERYKEVSEPLSNYIVSRIQKDYKKGNTVIGGIFTATNRFIEDANLYELNKTAYTAGIDLAQYFANRKYYLHFKTIASKVNGTKHGILKLQESSAHYFQRTDARYLSVDSNRTSLMGTGGYIAIGNDGNSKLRVKSTFNWRSPGLDLNDLGFMQQADNLRQMVNVSWVENEPKGIFRSYRYSLEESAKWTYGGERQELMTMISASAQFKNKYNVYGHVLREFKSFDTHILRGGPGLTQNPFWCLSASISADYSKPIAGYLSMHSHQYNDGFSNLYEFSPGIYARLNSKYTLFAELNYSKTRNVTQFVDNPNADNGIVYVLGNLSQTTTGMTFRFDLIFNPKFSIQYYGSPFISIGRYSSFKKVVNPKADEFNQRFHYYSDSEIQFNTSDNIYVLSETSGNTYQISNPDFSFREFKSNLVVKWEYRRGSFLYFVWSHNRSKSVSHYESSIAENFSELFGIYPSNVFLIKLNYYFSL